MDLRRLFLEGFLLVALACPALAQRHKLQVSDPSASREIIAQGGRLIADYGGYQLYEIDREPPFSRPGIQNRRIFGVKETLQELSLFHIEVSEKSRPFFRIPPL